MKSNFKIGSCILIVIATIILLYSASAQSISIKPDDRLTAKQRAAIIEKIAEIYNEYYPLPDMAAAMIDYLNKKRENNEYDQFTALNEFISQLQTDLRFLSNDQHIRVMPYEKIPDDLQAEMKLGTPDDNYGFQKVELLPGNIGYIELNTFINPITAGPTAVAAMNFVAHCDALIIDLRLNGGGDTDMGQFLSSYFFDRRTHLTDNYTRQEDKTDQFWTQVWVPGPRITEAPIYILLSKFTFSAAEEFAYDLQQLGRAKIIGAKTRGGAYSVKYMSFPELSINLKVPYTRDINPYSKTDYVGGVIPDIETSTKNAFPAANIEAIKLLLKTESDEDKKYKLQWALAGYEVDINPIVLTDAELAEYPGAYGDSQISVECGKIYYEDKHKIIYELVPMGDDSFKYRDQGQAKYRIQFSRDEKGKVVAFYEHDNDGDKYPVQTRK
jgi:hypothetical protein